MPKRARQTILVVDDNPTHRYATVRGLVKERFNVIEAWNGADALQKAAGSTAVVLDVCLPDLDGREVCRQLRADPATAELPIIHMSAVYTTDADREDCQGSGCDVFLVSPVPAQDLALMIDRLIEDRAAP